MKRFCPSLRNTSIGQITTEDSFSQIYSESKDFIDFLGKSISDLPCNDCRYGLLFHGGCRANSLSYAGKIWERDPICCSLSPFVEDVIVPLLPEKLKSSFYQSLQEEKSKPGDVSHPSSTHSWQRIQTIEIPPRQDS
ncbi:hypothetical protein, partial [Pseudomonas aeruginosa]|uniref:hypothetical protein n=1 Tax=Pseudomonas aeruginosa TaxID=287 RepID=UPI001EE6C98B